MDRTDFVGYFAIVIIIISLLSLGFSLTGKVTDTGVVNVTVNSVVSINFTTDFIDFGSGQVDAGQSSATVDTDGISSNGNWSSPADNFTIVNIGNNNVTLELATGKDAAAFIGGTSPSYQYKISNTEVGSCTNTTMDLDTWYDVNSTSPGTTICNPFAFEEGYDSIEVGIRLVIPSDASGGTKTDTFTATATAV